MRRVNAVSFNMFRHTHTGSSSGTIPKWKVTILVRRRRMRRRRRKRRRRRGRRRRQSYIFQRSVCFNLEILN